MLGYFREKFTGWVALLILGAIGLSFVFVGLNYNFTGQSYAAKVDGTTISVAQFENTFRQQLQQNPQFATLPENLRVTLRRNILEQLVQQRVIDNHLADAGYQVSAKQLTRTVHEIPEFQVDGVFNAETYRETLESFGRNVSEYEQTLMLELRRMQLQRAIRGASIVPPSSYRRFLNLAFEQRIVTTASITPELVAGEISISDEEIQAFYDDNPAMYQVPESADVQYVEVSRAEVAENVDVTEEQLHNYYEVNKDRYQQDEQRQARHILITFGDDAGAAETLANDVLARVRAGESFADLAAEFSKDGGTANNGGDLGVLTRTQLPDDLGAAIFSMQAGAVDGPIRGDFGFHIVRLDRILESGPLPFEQVRASLLTEVQVDQAEDLFRELERRVSDALFDASDIEAVAAATGLEIKTADAFPRTGGEPLGSSAALLDAVFDPAVTAGERMTSLVEIDADRTVVAAVTQYTPASRRPLADVRNAIATALTSQRSEELMAARAQSMEDALVAGDDFESAAEAVGASVNPPASMRRNDADADQLMMTAIFSAYKPEQGKPSVGHTRNNTGGFTVYRIDAVMPGRPESIPVAERDQGKLQLTDTYGIGDFVAFVQGLRNDADVVINEDALAAQDLFQ